MYDYHLNWYLKLTKLTTYYIKFVNKPIIFKNKLKNYANLNYEDFFKSLQ